MNDSPASRDNSSSSDSLYELVEQLTERLHRGEVVDLSEVLTAYPQHAEQLQQVLPALQILADVHDAPSVGSPAAASLSARSATDELTGMLGDFRLVREIGRGGMGVVYEARQISLDRRVALKVLPFAGVLDARHLQRFTNEARAAAGLHHPNIVPVYAVGCERGVHYYAMQYIDGQTLAQVIHEMRDSASGGRKPAGGSKVGDDLPSSSVEHAEEITNDEIQMSKEIRNPRVKNDRAQFRNALPVTEHKQCDIDVQPTGGDQFSSNRCPPRRSPKSLGTLNSLGSPDASTLRCFDSSTPARERFRTIAEWGIQIAEALDYAHSVGVIHRDIKPANIMLDSQGRVWVTDFGLAQFETDAGLTMTGDIVGTLRYMSPEQALGERGLVDQRTDVYSLGLALYELLTLKPAFGDANRRELLHRISNEDPVPPQRINPAIPVELETIVQKAAEKETAARYSTARELADDLRRYLHEQPIKARKATRRDRLRKWSRRNRVFVRACLAFSMLAVILLAVAGIWVDHERQQTKLEQQAHAADQKIAAAAYDDLRIHRYATNINLAERAWNSGRGAEIRQHLQACLPAPGEIDLRSFEWHYLESVTRDVPPVFAGHLGSVYCFRLSRDGRTAASGGQDGARIWNFQTGEELAHITAHNSDVNSVEFLSDATLLATGGDDHNARIWDTTTWRLVRTIPHAGNVVACLFTPDGKTLATGERDFHAPAGELIGENVVRLWDVATWESRGELRGLGSLMHSVAISDNGMILAAGGESSVCWWDLAEKTLLHRVPQSAKGLAFAHRRPLLVTVAGESIDLWRTADGGHEATLKDAVKAPECVAISRDDSTIVACGARGQIKVWEANRTGEYRVNPLLRTTYGIWSATFSDDTTLITTDRDGGAVRRWECRQNTDRRRIQFTGPTSPNFAISPDGGKLVTATCDLHVYDLETLSHVAQLTAPEQCALSVDFSPDGNAVAAGCTTGEIVVFDATTWRQTNVLPRHPSKVLLLEYTLDGNFLAVNYGQAILNVSANRLVPCPLPDLAPGDWMRFGPWGQGSCVGRGSLVQTWKGDRKLRELQVPQYCDIAIAPSGMQLACNSWDGTIRIWNLDDERPEFVFVGDTEPIDHLAFSADGRTLFGTAHRDRSVKLWNVATGRELLTLETALTVVHKLEVTSDGKTLVVSGLSVAGDGELSIWQIRPQLGSEPRQLSVEPLP